MYTDYQNYAILLLCFSHFYTKTDSQFTETPNPSIVKCTGNTANLRWNYLTNSTILTVQWFYGPTEMMSQFQTNPPAHSGDYNNSVVEFVADAEILLKALTTSSSGTYSCKVVYTSGDEFSNPVDLVVYDIFSSGLTCQYVSGEITCTKPDSSVFLNATDTQGSAIEMENPPGTGNYTICMYGGAIGCRGTFPTCTTVEVIISGKQTKEKSNTGDIAGGTAGGTAGVGTVIGVCVLVALFLSNVPYTVYALRKQRLILGRGLLKNWTIRCLKNDKEKNKTDNQFLVIESAKDSDEGEYVCEYSIKQEEIKLKINVLCIDGIRTAVQGQSILKKDFLPMSFEGYVLKKLKRKSDSKTEYQDINNVSHEDDGLYTCECTNPQGEEKQLDILLNIIDRKVTVTEGNYVDLKKKDFSFESQEKLIRWTLDGQPLFWENFIATEEYQGVYMCEWFTKVRKTSEKKIKVELIVKHHEITAVVGQKVKAKDIWPHVSVKKITGPKRTFSGDGELLCLENISYEDDGVYKCIFIDDGDQLLQLKFCLNVVDSEITAVVGQKILAKDIWQHISVANITGPKRNFSGIGTRLCLDNISNEDEGIYKCNYNDGGQQQHMKLRLKVVDCEYKAYVGKALNPNDVWPKFQVKSIKGPNGKVFDNVGSLYLENLSQADDGIYLCECCDGDGKDIQLKFLLSVVEEEKVSSHAQGAPSTTTSRDIIQIISEAQIKYESRSNQLGSLSSNEKLPLLDNPKELTAQPLPNIPESENGKKRSS